MPIDTGFVDTQRAKRQILGLGGCEISDGKLSYIETGRDNIIHFPKDCLYAQRYSIKTEGCIGICVNKEFIGGVENIFDKPEHSPAVHFAEFCGTGYNGVVDIIHRMERQGVGFSFATLFKLSEENFIPQMVGVLVTSIMDTSPFDRAYPTPLKPRVEIEKQDAWERLKKNPEEKLRVESELRKRLSKINAEIPKWFYE